MRSYLSHEGTAPATPGFAPASNALAACMSAVTDACAAARASAMAAPEAMPLICARAGACGSSVERPRARRCRRGSWSDMRNMVGVGVACVVGME